MVVRKQVFIALGSLVLWTASALAGPINPQQVAADAKWYIHVDVEALAKTVIGQQIKEAIKDKMPSQDWLERCKKSFGFDPEKDLKGLTLYNPTLQEKAFIGLLYCTLDQDFVTKLIALNPDYAKSNYGDHVLHAFTDKDKGNFMVLSFVSKELMAVASSVDNMKLALDVLDGKKPGKPAMIAPSAAGAFVQGLVTNLGDAARQPKSQMLANAESGQAAVGELDGKFFLSVSLTTTTPETSAELKQILDGLKAMVLINAKQNPAAAEMVQHAVATAEGKTVTLKFDYDSKQLFSQLKEMDRQHKRATSQPTSKADDMVNLEVDVKVDTSASQPGK